MGEIKAGRFILYIKPFFQKSLNLMRKGAKNMKALSKTRKQLIEEVTALQARISELEAYKTALLRAGPEGLERKYEPILPANGAYE